MRSTHCFNAQLKECRRIKERRFIFMNHRSSVFKGDVNPEQPMDALFGRSEKKLEIQRPVFASHIISLTLKAL